tara:strand:- start:68 stop:325 length:258 start_codon:yes stop_codon:yes gene_type:complete
VNWFRRQWQRGLPSRPVRTVRNAAPHASVTVKRNADANPDVAKRIILTQDRQVDLHKANLHTANLHTADLHKADLLLIDILDIER